MPVVQVSDLTTLATAIYEAAGTPPEHARIVVAHQAGANLAGHDSHGSRSSAPCYETWRSPEEGRHLSTQANDITT